MYLYAATPILRQIVASLLADIGAQFQIENDLFHISGDHRETIATLRKTLSEAEQHDIRVTNESGAALLAATSLDEYGYNLSTQWFDDALEADRFTSHFQPIVDTAQMSVYAHECLIRLFADRPYNGGEIMDAAVSRGRLHVFDSYARRLSIRMAGQQYIPGTKVFVNFMPSSIYDPEFCMRSTMEEMSKTALLPQDIIFEVVESDKVRDVKHLQKICDYYKKNGFGFALDDVGTGANSLQMVCDLQPDYIKLDKSLISKINQPMYRAAVEKLAEFAQQFKLEVIAEGIEDATSIPVLQAMGINLMQGYFFGRPDAKMKSRIQNAGQAMANDLTQISNYLGKAIAPASPSLVKV